MDGQVRGRKGRRWNCSAARRPQPRAELQNWPRGLRAHLSEGRFAGKITASPPRPRWPACQGRWGHQRRLAPGACSTGLLTRHKSHLYSPAHSAARRAPAAHCTAASANKRGERPAECRSPLSWESRAGSSQRTDELATREEASETHCRSIARSSWPACPRAARAISIARRSQRRRRPDSAPLSAGKSRGRVPVVALVAGR